MRAEIKSVVDQGKKDITDARVLWDFVKMKVHEKTKKYSKGRAQETKENLRKLQGDIQKLELSLVISPDNDTLQNLKSKRKELKVLYDQKVVGLKVRSRAKWFEESEINENYFKQLLASNQKKTFIDKLQLDGRNEETSDPKQILKEIKHFYHNLYSENEKMDRTDDLFFNMSHLNISEASKKSCDEKITFGECTSMLNKMSLNKSPGNDGLSVEFYRIFGLI